MSEKRKTDVVSEQMRQRLMSNRDGRIATDQWLDLVTEPLVILLLLVVPAAVILGPRFIWFAVSLPIPVILLLALLAIAVPLFIRARRYARAPVLFDVMYADINPVAPLMFWRPQTFETKDGRKIRFRRRLAPYMFYRPGYPYLVYYLEDTSGPVLLSVAPADHPDAERWYPTKFYERRTRAKGRPFHQEAVDIPESDTTQAQSAAPDAPEQRTSASR